MDFIFSEFDDFSELFPHQDYINPIPKQISLGKQNSFLEFEQPETLEQQHQQNQIFDLFDDQSTPSNPKMEKQNMNIKDQIQKIIKKKNNKIKSKSKAKAKSQSKSKDYRKNICRNIIRHAVKSMITCETCSEYIDQLVNDPKQFKVYYNRILESLSGPRVLRQNLVPSPTDNIYEQNKKLAFKRYLTWYLKTRATQMILSGETLNPKEYLQYKNEILMYYIQRPEEWTSNTPEWRDMSDTWNIIYNLQG